MQNICLPQEQRKSCSAWQSADGRRESCPKRDNQSEEAVLPDGLAGSLSVIFDWLGLAKQGLTKGVVRAAGM